MALIHVCIFVTNILLPVIEQFISDESNYVCVDYRIEDFKLIWGPYGFSDRYGNETIEYWRDPDVLALVNMTQTSKPGEGNYDGYIPKFTPQVSMGEFIYSNPTDS